jgi:hypothetical protein
MTDYGFREGLISQVLSDDATINSMVDFFLPGIQMINADSDLAGTNGCSVSIYTRAGRSMGLPGAAYHGMAEVNQLICIDVHCQDGEPYNTARGNASTYAGQVQSAIENLLRKCICQDYQGKSYQIGVGNQNWVPVRNPAFPNRILINGTIEATYMG